MERRQSQLRKIVFIATFVSVILLIMDSNNRGFMLPGVAKTKFIMFVGYRRHWNQTRPYRCRCGVGLELFVNSSNGRHKDPKDIKSADLVIFVLTANLYNKWKAYHSYRHNGQKWMFATRESPLTSQDMIPPEIYRFNSFHWSYTYSPYATFPAPYGRYIRSSRTLYSPGEVDWSENKTRLISWTSSNCPLPDFRYHRQRFVLNLAQYIKIDMYGACGNLTCPKQSEECFHILKSYKFALALENSCCSDYISEKFWKALTYKQVPVVFGAKREDYEKVAPPNSFIFIEDFESLEDLANYLLMLDGSNTLYNAYHEWRNEGWARTAQLPTELVYHCDALCRVAVNLDNSAPNWNEFSFDPYDQSWFGGCRSCSDAIKPFLGEEVTDKHWTETYTSSVVESTPLP